MLKEKRTPTIPDIQQVLISQRHFYEDRPSMLEGNDKTFLRQAIADEAEELNETPPEYMDERQYDEQELADVLLFAFALSDSLANESGEDTGDFIARIVMEKIARNMAKYPAREFQNGTPFSESLGKCKDEWVEIRGNEQFYEEPEQEAMSTEITLYEAPKTAIVLYEAPPQWAKLTNKQTG